jgi:hypothetical protein
MRSECQSPKLAGVPICNRVQRNSDVCADGRVYDVRGWLRIGDDLPALGQALNLLRRPPAQAWPGRATLVSAMAAAKSTPLTVWRPRTLALARKRLAALTAGTDTGTGTS